MAQGRRGTRWRELTTGKDGLATTRSLLAEESPVGTVSRLEVTDGAGLLTLHPSGDGSELHGNVVTPNGVRHLAFAWGDEHALVVGSSPAMLAIAVHRWKASVAVRAATELVGLDVGDELGVIESRLVLERLAEDVWRCRTEREGSTRASAMDMTLRVDADGVPIHPGSEVWPLER
jgi:hypothetical protein